MFITIAEYDEEAQIALRDGTESIFHGTALPHNRKQSFTAKRTIGGRRREQYSNPYKSLDINVDFMDSDMYLNMVTLYYNAQRVIVITEDGEEYIMNFSSDTLSLQRDWYNEDGSEEEYRFGNLQLEE